MAYELSKWLRLGVGYVGVPTIEAFGVEATGRLSAQLQLAFWYARYNAPDILARFPYALGSWQGGLQFAGAF